MTSSKPGRAIIIPAAGSGTRFQSALPKQFHTLGSDPILVHTLRTACAVSDVGTISIGVQGDIDQMYLQLRGWGITDARIQVYEGAEERQLTVLKGLQHWSMNNVDADGVVLVHDAVRPLATVDLWERVAIAAEQHGAAVPFLPMADTVKMVSDGVVERTLDRSRLVRVQTPQGFRIPVLRSSYEHAVREGLSLTDCSSAVELSGHTVHLVPGEEVNIKITTPYDLAMAEIIVANFAR